MQIDRPEWLRRALLAVGLGRFVQWRVAGRAEMQSVVLAPDGIVEMIDWPWQGHAPGEQNGGARHPADMQAEMLRHAGDSFGPTLGTGGPYRAADLDLMTFGTGAVRIGQDGFVEHVPLSDLPRRSGDGREGDDGQ